MRLYASLLLWGMIVSSGSVDGQSLLGSSGLGMRLEPLDAVQRALGGVGVATRWSTLLPGNPAASLDILAPTVAFTVQPHWGTYTVGSADGDFIGTRFPVIGFAYPLGTNDVLTLAAGSHFDQNWSFESTDSIAVVAGDQANVGFTDTFLSEGAIATIQAGWARHLSSSVAVGVTAGIYRGGLTRSFDRTFDLEVVDSVEVESQVNPFTTEGRWNQSGLLTSLNVLWDPNPILQLGATVSWSGNIKVAPAEEFEGPERKVAAPIEYKASAIVLFSPALAANLGATYSDWSDLGAESLDAAGSGGVTSFGGGVEWEVGNFWAGPLPLRFGYRRSKLPFRFLDRPVKEKTFSGGFSLVMAQVLDLPLAAVDFSLELGTRSASDFEESFRRVTVTMRVGGR